jgi:hypothetical protein
MNLGTVYRSEGAFSKALVAWREAWGLSKDLSDAQARAVAGKALGEMATLNASLGQRQELRRILDEAEGRDVGGSAAEKVSRAREALYLLDNHYELVTPSGSTALDRLLANTRRGYRTDPALLAFRTTPIGASLTEINASSGRARRRLTTSGTTAPTSSRRPRRRMLPRRRSSRTTATLTTPRGTGRWRRRTQRPRPPRTTTGMS